MKRFGLAKFTLGITLSLALALLAGVLAFSTTSTTRASSQDVVEAGKTVYQKNCAVCHGSEGQGNLGIPNLAGAAGHVKQLGIPPEVAGPAIVGLLRAGIPGNMPSFPPEILSDEDIMNLGAYLFTVPPTTGANLYIANCALCHGTKAEGKIGPPLAGVAEKVAEWGLTKEQVAAGFPDLVRKGIPGRMPAFPQFTDEETSSLFEYLWGVPGITWEAEFQATHGRAPTAEDRADRAWSEKFLKEKSRPPTDEEWAQRWYQTHK